MRRIFSTADYQIEADGQTDVTGKLQKLLDDAGKEKGCAVVARGIYRTGSLFLHSDMELHLEEGAVLLGSQEEAAYPLMQTRAAGIEMEWMGALLNAIDCENIRISGPGTLDGQGEIWWEKFWGKDRNGGMCRDYAEKGLRWAADYDCIRPRLVQLRNCRHVVCEDFHLTRSGFWNLHVCYCQDVRISGIRITDAQGPSTDGIDIDSSSEVLVENCDISCNDDNIVLKAGMNADGMRVNRICEKVEVRNCILREGMGLAFGSDMAGGIDQIYLHDLQFRGTDNGVYVKSAKIRGGFLDHIRVENLHMVNVGYAVNLNTNWFPDFSYPQIPADYQGEIPKRWKLLTEKVPAGKGMPEVRDMRISSLTATYEESYTGKSVAFFIQAYDSHPIRNVRMEHVRITAKEFGSIRQVENLSLNDVEVTVKT
ncbi:MAG: glycosyl hydrolase family 28 protein [Eubacteriales bacterium]|nr:glycosyl hydrolase family 28 protein [Eubacteriales bacterium]